MEMGQEDHGRGKIGQPPGLASNDFLGGSTQQAGFEPAWLLYILG